MEKTTHTPGPWTLPPNGLHAWQESKYPYLWHAPVHTRPLTREDGQCTAILGHKCYGATAQEAEANARLIAAAPDLLVACELRRMLDAFVEPNRVDKALKGNIERRCRELGWKGDQSCLFADFIRSLADAAIAKAEGGEKSFSPQTRFNHYVNSTQERFLDRE